MSHMRQALGIALIFSAAVEAAEPPAHATPAEKPARAPAAATTSTRAPLNLQIGDVRRYMMPSEYRAAVSGSDSTIVVEGERPAPPLRSTQPIPGGIAAPFWMIAHPLNAWRAKPASG